MSRHVLIGVAIVTFALAGPVQGDRAMFVPDWTFKGNTLTGWRVLGEASFRALNGEIIGTPQTPAGGWLILDKSFQDVEVGFDFQMASGAKTGLLLRAEKTPSGMKGVYVSLSEGEQGAYAVTLDGNGKELTRERLRSGGGLMRVAPTAAEAAATAAARGARAGGAPAGAPGGPPAGRAAGAGGGGGLGAAAARCRPGRNCRTWRSPAATNRTTGMTCTSSSTPTSCGSG